MKSIFVSRLYEDRKWSEKIKEWQKNNLLKGYAITYETKDLRHLGENEIKKYLKKMINGATILLVLIGDDTHNHNWIKYEVELANSYHKKVFWLQIPNTKGAILPILKNKQELKDFSQIINL